MLFALVLFLSLIAQSLAAREMRPRVIGGTPDDAGEFPFVVMIQFALAPFYRFCTGSLIAPTWVLTAAHCTPLAGKENEKRVKYGDFTIPSNETRFFVKIIKALRYPGSKFLIGRIINEIGLLKTENIPNTPLAKLSAVDYAAFMGLPVKYAGFGRNKLHHKREDPYKPNVLNDYDLPLRVGKALVISCKQDGGLTAEIPVICIAPRCGPRRQPYYGDSGGPLVYNGRIIGVTSGAKDESIPLGGFTPVSPFLDWIHDTMKSDYS